MNWATPPWVLAGVQLIDGVPWQWLQWVIDYQVACHDAEKMRAQIQAARGQGKGTQ
jgi:hypothetical protein